MDKQTSVAVKCIVCITITVLLAVLLINAPEILEAING